MRNLQKILALVLALVMSLSLMATAGAEFTDQADIDDAFAESVDVLNGLEVFQGYPTGDFQPKGEITRAEVAAIIYRIATGDVDDTQVGIYADYDKFSDVYASETYSGWAAGYINYCANAEYIKGRGDGKFYPQDKVTGYEALAMILRVVGYDKNGEFTGADWQVQTAAIANQQKVTKNVNAGLLGQPATREMVAELLCQAILIPTVNYTLAYGYQQSTNPQDTIAYQTFQMEKLTGVVTGNEIADLYASSPKPAGQTDLRVDGSEITLNVVSGLDDIGESCRVYVRPQTGTTRYDIVTSKVYPTETNNVYDEGARVGTLSASTVSSAGINSLEGAEHFINFDQATDYEARIRIRYVVELAYSEYEIQMLLNSNNGTATHNGADVAKESLNNADSWDTRRTDGNPYVYTKTIEAFAKLTDQDYDFIRTIFAKGDYTNNIIKGEVYVGTNTQIANPDDISDDIRWEDFVATYLKVEENAKQVTSNGLGNRLKVIDNNNDGVADYVLQTIFTVAKIGANGKLDIDGMKFADTSYNDNVNVVSGKTPVSVSGINLEASDAALNPGDVVIYAYIDGNVRAQVAESETSRVTSINRSTTPPTATIESGEKKQSAVHTHSEGLASGVSSMVIGTNYTSYFDLYGNLAAFTEGEVGKFVLITDGWFNQNVNAREYAVQAYLDGQLQNVTITNNGQLFIETNSGTNNSWNHLKALGGNNGVLNTQGGTHLKTTVACLDGGNLLPVEQSTYYRQRVAMIDMIDNAIPVNNGGATGNVWYTSANYYTDASAYDTAGAAGVQVLGRSDTVYYTVYKSGTNSVTGQPNYVVRSYTGYANVPSINRTYIEDVYAVGIAANGTTTSANPLYYTAEVVVIELNNKYQYQNDSEQVFIPGITVVNNDVARTAGRGIETITMIRGNGEVQDVQVDMSQSEINWYRVADTNQNNNSIFAGLYYMDPTDANPSVYRIRPMREDDIRANNYLAGYVTQSTAIVPTDYVRVDMQLFTGTRDASGNLTGIAIPGVPTLAANNMEPTQEASVNANSKLYTLRYSSYVANLKEAAAGVVFEQNPDRNVSDVASVALNETWEQNTPATFNWNPRNEVLVRYENGTVVWAISFNEYSSTSSAARDFAQTVWYNCLPAQTADTSSYVKFWGVGIDADLSTESNTIEISHSTAFANKDLGIIDLDAFAGTIKSYTLSKRTSATTWEQMSVNDEINAATNGRHLTKAREEYRLTITLNNGNAIEYYLIKRAADNTALLAPKSTTTGTQIDSNNEFTDMGTGMTLLGFIEQFNVSAGATAKWTFKTNDGIIITAEGKNYNTTEDVPQYTFQNHNRRETMSEIASVVVTVTPEDGTAASSQTYRRGVASVSVSAPAGATIDGAASKTVYGGDVLTLKAPRAGVFTVTINGKNENLTVSAPDFSVQYTVPGDMTSMSVTFTADLVNIKWNKTTSNGFDPVRVNGYALVLNNSGTEVSVGAPGTVTVEVTTKQLTNGTYVIYATKGSSRVEGRVTFSNDPAGTTKSVTLDQPLTAGTWTLDYAELATGFVNVEWTGSNASVYLTTDTQHLSDKMVVDEPMAPGTTLSFVIVPASGYQLSGNPTASAGSIVKNADGSYTYTMPSTNNSKVTITVNTEAVADVETAVKEAQKIATAIKNVSGLGTAASEALSALQNAKTQADVSAAMSDLKTALGAAATDTLVIPEPAKLPGTGVGGVVDNKAAADALSGGVVVASPATFPSNANSVKVFGTPDNVFRKNETATAGEIQALNALWWQDPANESIDGIVSEIFNAIERGAFSGGQTVTGVDSFAYICIPNGNGGQYTGDDAWVMVYKTINGSTVAYTAVNWQPDVSGISW